MSSSVILFILSIVLSEPSVKRLAGGGVAAHRGHVPRDGDGGNRPFPEPAFQFGVRETAGERFLQEQIPGMGRHGGVELPSRCARTEGPGFGGGGGVRDHHHGDLGLPGGPQSPENVVERAVGVGDGEGTVEVFVLPVDDQKSSFHKKQIISRCVLGTFRRNSRTEGAVRSRG